MKISGKDNANRFSLAYGPVLHPHLGTDDFDFNDPLFKLNRYKTLFDEQALVTDPIAFLNRLHYKAIRSGRYPAKHTLHRLCRLFAKYLDIDTSRWQEKGFDLGEVWQALKGWQQTSILPVLDMTRHLTDAFPSSGTPLQMHGVVILDELDQHCVKSVFSGWIKLMDEMFPNIQFIATLPARYITRFPDRIIKRRLKLPRENDKPASRSPQNVSRVGPNTVLLIHIDGRLPNLALVKLSGYYKSLGYNIHLSRKPELIQNAESVFASSVFFSNTSQNAITRLRKYYGESIQIGGSGVDLKLRLAPEIEGCTPDYDLYTELNDRAIGFITRGCPYRCKFCLVPEKEGNVHQVIELDDLLKGREKLILLDDNLLAYSNAEEILQQMINRNLRVNFTQTLDIRLLNSDLVKLLKKINWSNTRFTRPVIHFSLNSLSGLKRVIRNYQLFDFHKSDNVEFVCMYDYDTTLEEDVERFAFIRSLPGAYVFVQQYQPIVNAQPKPRVVFFDSNCDRLIDKLITIEYGQNMKSMEQYYRWLSKCYVQEYGYIHQRLVDTIFRYNNRANKGLYVNSLLSRYGPRTDHA